MDKITIKKQQASFGKQVVKDVLGRTIDEGFMLVHRIPHGDGYIDMEVIQRMHRGKRVCFVEGWIMTLQGRDDWFSTQHVESGPFPVNTPLAKLVPLAYGLIPVLKAKEIVLSKHACELYYALTRSKKDQRQLLDHLNKRIVAAASMLKKQAA